MTSARVKEGAFTALPGAILIAATLALIAVLRGVEPPVTEAHVYRVTVGTPAGISITEVPAETAYARPHGCTELEDKDSRMVARACHSHSVVRLR